MIPPLIHRDPSDSKSINDNSLKTYEQSSSGKYQSCCRSWSSPRAAEFSSLVVIISSAINFVRTTAPANLGVGEFFKDKEISYFHPTISDPISIVVNDEFPNDYFP